MSNIFAAIADVIENKRRMDARRSGAVTVVRAPVGSDCVAGVEWPSSYRLAESSESQRIKRCQLPAAYEIRGTIRRFVCAGHLAWSTDRLLDTDVDEMEGHFGRHSSIARRAECSGRNLPVAGDVFVPVKVCGACADIGESRSSVPTTVARRKKARQPNI
jgi:hypothetical protein